MSNEILQKYALSFLGAPYIWGGNHPNAWDCSGLCIEILKAAGIVEGTYDSSAMGIYKDLLGQKKASLDLVAFENSFVFFGKSVNNITHVGFCLTPELMIEAGGGDDTCTTPEIAFKKQAFVKVRPIAHRNDRIAFLHPFYSWS